MGVGAGAVVAYFRGERHAVAEVLFGKVRDVQEEAVQGAAGQFHVGAVVARGRVVVVRAVDPAAHELQFVHTGRVTSPTDNGGMERCRAGKRATMAVTAGGVDREAERGLAALRAADGLDGP
ncbi:hypothetical protein SHKM778_41460 [Streptomyces sp. KM77-8]|uniref:Uncharacterized protein n=1 Tax=Streptomyces haneummycinicus TaxID=3074435 RepID=A0AAT9HK06_9ACTN